MASTAEHEDDSVTRRSSSLGARTSNAATDGSMEEKQGRKRLCPHCSDLVSRATYFRHKRVFYNYQSKKWNKSQPSNSTSTAAVSSAVEVGGADSDVAPPLDNGMHEVHLCIIHNHSYNNNIYLAYTHNYNRLY